MLRRIFVIIFVFCSLLFATANLSKAVGFISEITELSFSSVVLESNEPIIVWFYSGYSDKLMSDVDAFLRKKFIIRLVKMDKSFNNLTAAKYNIVKNDTLVFFADGKELSRTTSIKTIDDFEEFAYYNLKEYAKQENERTKNEWVPSAKNKTKANDKADKTR